MNPSMGEHWDSLVKLIIEMSRKDPTNPNLKELNDTVFQTVDNVKNTLIYPRDLTIFEIGRACGAAQVSTAIREDAINMTEIAKAMSYCDMDEVARVHAVLLVLQLDKYLTMERVSEIMETEDDEELAEFMDKFLNTGLLEKIQMGSVTSFRLTERGKWYVDKLFNGGLLL